MLFCAHFSGLLLLNKYVHENSELGSIKKLGEGTYGEAFRAGSTVCKVVPFDGDLLVNGEIQKVCFINLYFLH